MPCHLSHPAGASRIQTSHHHHLDGSALPRGALPCNPCGGCGATLIHRTGSILVFHPTAYCATTQNAPVLLLSRRKPLLTSGDLTFNEASGQSESLTVPVHDPAHLHTGVCFATHTRTLLLPSVLTCWLQGAGSHPWLHHTRLHAIWLSPNALGRGKVTTPVRLQAIPPYLA